MKSQAIHKTSKFQTLEFKLKLENQFPKENRILAEISKNYLPGDTAKLRIHSKFLEAKITTKLYANETILLEKQDTQESQWAILKRTSRSQFISSDSKITSQANESKNFTRDLHERGIQESLDKILTNQEPSEIAEEKVLKMLNQLFSFFPWSKNVEMYNWTWEKAKAEGYFSSEENQKFFLLEYDSRAYHKSRFLFCFSKDGTSWNLISQFESAEFYELFLDQIQILKNYLQEDGILPQTILAEYTSRSFSKETQGWLA